MYKISHVNFRGHSHPYVGRSRLRSFFLRQEAKSIAFEQIAPLALGFASYRKPSRNLARDRTRSPRVPPRREQGGQNVAHGAQACRDSPTDDSPLRAGVRGGGGGLGGGRG